MVHHCDKMQDAKHLTTACICTEMMRKSQDTEDDSAGQILAFKTEGTKIDLQNSHRTCWV